MFLLILESATKICNNFLGDFKDFYIFRCIWGPCWIGPKWGQIWRGINWQWRDKRPVCGACQKWSCPVEEGSYVWRLDLTSKSWLKSSCAGLMWISWQVTSPGLNAIKSIFNISRILVVSHRSTPHKTLHNFLCHILLLPTCPLWISTIFFLSLNEYFYLGNYDLKLAPFDQKCVWTNLWLTTSNAIFRK
jgi:hypothetical protein